MKYFTSDTHFCHTSIAEVRGFASIAEHDAAILDGINSAVEPDDQLYILGDFALDFPGRYRPKIRCKTVFFVIGNHDRPLKTQQAFGEAPHMRFTKFGTCPVVLSHYPQCYWSGSHHGHAHFYGHCHASREDTLDSLFPGRRSIDVGVDNAFRLLGSYVPFPEDLLIAHFDARPGHDQPSFYDSQREG